MPVYGSEELPSRHQQPAKHCPFDILTARHSTGIIRLLDCFTVQVCISICLASVESNAYTTSNRVIVCAGFLSQGVEAEGGSGFCLVAKLAFRHAAGRSLHMAIYIWPASFLRVR